MEAGRRVTRSGDDPQPLEVGECAQVAIRARDKWNLTGILLEDGATYELVATSTWKDWYRTAGPSGYDSSARTFFERMRRFKDADWFALIGALDRDDASAFVIGDGCTYAAHRDGQLCCYANDMYASYWNNSGAVELTVTRIA